MDDLIAPDPSFDPSFASPEGDKMITPTFADTLHHHLAIIAADINGNPFIAGTIPIIKESTFFGTLITVEHILNFPPDWTATLHGKDGKLLLILRKADMEGNCMVNLHSFQTEEFGDIPVRGIDIYLLIVVPVYK